MKLSKFTLIDIDAAKSDAGYMDENLSIKEGQCLKCDFEPSFKERVTPRISEGSV